MKIYIYDNKTGEYLGERNAQPNPKRKGEYLFPKNSTTVIPPSLKENEGLFFKNGKWTIIKDFRGKEIINLETKEVSIADSLGDLENSYQLWGDYILTPEYQNDLNETKKQEQRAKLLDTITELDIKRIRAICEPSVKDEETGETWLEYYNNQIILLRAELEVI